MTTGHIFELCFAGTLGVGLGVLMLALAVALLGIFDK